MTISTQFSRIQAGATNASSTIAQSMQMLNHALPIKLDKDNNLVAIRELIHDRDHIMQLLRGLGVEYNSIMASFIAREDEISLHMVYSILLTYE